MSSQVQHITLGEGDTVVVVLQGNLSTGYSWSVAYSPPCLRDAGKNETPRSTLIGAGENIQWSWLATSKCRSQPLCLTYSRPWDATTRTDYCVLVTVEKSKTMPKTFYLDGMAKITKN